MRTHKVVDRKTPAALRQRVPKAERVIGSNLRRRVHPSLGGTEAQKSLVSRGWSSGLIKFLLVPVKGHGGRRPSDRGSLGSFALRAGAIAAVALICGQAFGQPAIDPPKVTASAVFETLQRLATWG